MLMASCPQPHRGHLRSSGAPCARRTMDRGHQPASAPFTSAQKISKTSTSNHSLPRAFRGPGFGVHLTSSLVIRSSHHTKATSSSLLSRTSASWKASRARSKSRPSKGIRMSKAAAKGRPADASHGRPPSFTASSAFQFPRLMMMTARCAWCPKGLPRRRGTSASAAHDESAPRFSRDQNR